MTTSAPSSGSPRPLDILLIEDDPGDVVHADAYVTKPVELDGFVAAIREIDHFFVSVVRRPEN